MLTVRVPVGCPRRRRRSVAMKTLVLAIALFLFPAGWRAGRRRGRCRTAAPLRPAAPGWMAISPTWAIARPLVLVHLGQLWHPCRRRCRPATAAELESVSLTLVWSAKPMTRSCVRPTSSPRIFRPHGPRRPGHRALAATRTAGQLLVDPAGRIRYVALEDATGDPGIAPSCGD